MDTNRREFYRKQLTNKLQDLTIKITERLSEAVRDPEERAIDLYDVSTQSYSKEQLYSSCNRDRETVLSIQAALEKLKNGEYGICDECEQVINEKRLKALPWVRLCLDCQNKREARAVAA
jgi:DnaK suppressor protein